MMEKKVKLRCGECSGLNKDKLKDKKNACSELGYIRTNKACSSFVPNVFELDFESEALASLGRLLEVIPTSKLKLMAAIIDSESTTRRNGYKLGQRVYVRYRGVSTANYMSNFMSARILYANKNIVKLIGDVSKSSLTYLTATGPNGPCIYTKKAFAALREEMLRQVDGDIYKSVDPDVDKIAIKRLRAQSLEALEMTSKSKKGMIASYDDVAKQNNLKEDEDAKDLISIVRDIERGFVINDTAKPKRRKRRKQVSTLSGKKTDSSFEVRD